MNMLFSSFIKRLFVIRGWYQCKMIHLPQCVNTSKNVQEDIRWTLEETRNQIIMIIKVYYINVSYRE